MGDRTLTGNLGGRNADATADRNEDPGHDDDTVAHVAVNRKIVETHTAT